MKLEIQKGEAWPRRTALTGAGLLLLLFLLPMIFLPGRSGDPVATLPTQPAAPQATPRSGWDGGAQLKVLMDDGGTVETMTMADYIWGVVAAEMPASFRNEALKAQAVAARTYCLYRRNNGVSRHPQADICTDSGCCQAFLSKEDAAVKWGDAAARYTDKLIQAVSDTDGLVCLYKKEPINAVFFSSAAGKTSDAAAVWGRDVPYLTSVDSPEGEEVPGWHTLATFTLEEFSQQVLSVYPDADLSGESAGWVTDLTADDTGMVTTLSIGGVELTGREARSLFGLRSTHFTVETDADAVIFRVLGFGHGVGMSQYGANALAAQGKNFEEILHWYYTGIDVGGWD